MKTRTKIGRKVIGSLVSASLVFSMLPAMLASAIDYEPKTKTVTVSITTSGTPQTINGIKVSASGGNIDYNSWYSRLRFDAPGLYSAAASYSFEIDSEGALAGGKFRSATIVTSGTLYSSSDTVTASGNFSGNISGNSRTTLSWTGNSNKVSLGLQNGKYWSTQVTIRSISFEVEIPITEESIADAVLYVGDGSTALTTSCSPATTTYSDADLTWTSSATGVATVAYNSASGKVEVTPVAFGVTTITASLGDTTLGTATIKVYEHVSDVTLSEVPVPVFSDGAPFQITATVTNEALIKPGCYTVSWESSAPSIASVSDTGVVTPVAPGDVTITATLTDSTVTTEGSGVITKTVGFTVYSSDEPVVVVVPPTLELTTDSDPVALDYSVEAPEGHNITLDEFYCEDDDVITVGWDDGVVTPVGVGEATVEVWVYDELLEDYFCGTCVVTVTEPSPEPEPPTPGPEPTPEPEPTQEEPSLTPEQIQRMAVNHFVERLYVEGLGRTFDVAGRDGWTDILLNGGSASAVVHGFFGSSEFIGLNTSNEEFVTRLYKVFFDRTPDTEGFNNWVTALNNGALTRTQVVDEFAHSPEWAAFCARYSVNV